METILDFQDGSNLMTWVLKSGVHLRIGEMRLKGKLE